MRGDIVLAGYELDCVIFFFFSCFFWIVLPIILHRYELVSYWSAVRSTVERESQSVKSSHSLGIGCGGIVRRN